MPARCGIPTVIAAGAALLSGCISAPLAPPAAAVPVAPAPVAATAAAPIVLAPAAPAAPCTLGGFLGITPMCAAVGKDVHHKLAFFGQYFPFLEPKPPLLLLTDPANLASSVPAIAAAAEIKAEQDMAPQKIKALKYLATIGCGGCYVGVEEAFLAALEDCTEEVRFEAVKAIYATTGSPCVHCNEKACCSPRLRKKLAEMAFEGMPCPKEPSARVRRMARVALTACGAPPPPIEVPPAGPVEVIPVGPTEVAPPPDPLPPPPPPEPYAATALPVPAPIASVTASSRSSVATASNIVPPFNSKLDVATALASKNAEPAVEAASPALTEADTETKTVDADDVTDEELAAYHAAHRDRYLQAEQVRWESVSVSIDDFASHDKAMDVMLHVRRLALGEVLPAPESFRPELITAHRHDWTPRSEIASPPVAAALFTESTESTESVSNVMTDGQRLILVRVLERRPAGEPPFAEVVERVRADLLTERATDAFVSTDQAPPAKPSTESLPMESPASDEDPTQSGSTNPTVPSESDMPPDVMPAIDADRTEPAIPAQPLASSSPRGDEANLETWSPIVTMDELILGPGIVPDVIRLSHSLSPDDQSAETSATALP